MCPTRYFKISVDCEVYKSGAALTQPWANDKHPACSALLHLTHILHKQKDHKGRQTGREEGIQIVKWVSFLLLSWQQITQMPVFLSREVLWLA